MRERRRGLPQFYYHGRMTHLMRCSQYDWINIAVPSIFSLTNEFLDKPGVRLERFDDNRMRTSVSIQIHRGFAVFSFLAIGALAFAADIDLPGTEQTPLVINHLEVSREEFRWFMDQERTGVIAVFKAEHNLEYGEGFWNHEAGGTTPRAALQKRTLGHGDSLDSGDAMEV
jgi:hypothetical protein